MIHETTLAIWLTNGPRLIRQLPEISFVRLSDKEPKVSHLKPEGEQVYWCRSSGNRSGIHLLPPMLHQHLPKHEAFRSHGFYPNDYTAIAALSQALIAWAREQPDPHS